MELYFKTWGSTELEWAALRCFKSYASWHFLILGPRIDVLLRLIMFLSAIQMLFITAPIACFNQFHITFGIRYTSPIHFFHRTNNFHLVGQKRYFFSLYPHPRSPVGESSTETLLCVNGPDFIFFLPRPLEFWEKSPSSRSLTTSCQARSGHGETMWKDLDPPEWSSSPLSFVSHKRGF